MESDFGPDADAPRKRRLRVPFRRARPAAEQQGSPEADAMSSFGGVDGAGDERREIERAQPDELDVRRVERDGRHTLLLSGELSLESVETLERAVRELPIEVTKAVTLDLTGLVFIDSSGLWAITTVRRWCKQGMIEFSIIPGPESVQSVFELTGLSDLLPFESDGGRERPPGAGH